MNIRTVNAAIIAEAVKQMIIEAATTDPALEGITATRAEVPNEDPSLCPWAGVYKTNLQFPSRTLGAGPGSRYQQTALTIIAQYAGGENGQECEDGLETVVQGIVSALCNDQTLKGNVDILTTMTVTYDSYNQVEDTFMQEAFISITAVTTVTAS
jgi:hypothetical protein